MARSRRPASAKPVSRKTGSARTSARRGKAVPASSPDLRAKIAALERELAGVRSERDELQVDEIRWRSLAEQSPLGIIAYRPDGTVKYANPALQRLSELTDEENALLVAQYNILEDPRLRASGTLEHVRKAFAGEVTVLPPVMYERPSPIENRAVRRWLEDFEASRGNYFGALRLAEAQPEADEAHLEELRRKASEQALEAASREKRRDVRLSLLKKIAREFQGTEAGRQAGERAREEVLKGTPQKIQVTRGFLLENPRLAGPEGLALRPELLDDDLHNGELHPEGVTFLGGRMLQFAFINESGNDRDPPRKTRTAVSP